MTEPTIRDAFAGLTLAGTMPRRRKMGDGHAEAPSRD